MRVDDTSTAESSSSSPSSWTDSHSSTYCRYGCGLGDELYLTLRDCETCKLRAKHCLHLSKHRNMHAPRHASEPCAWALKGWKGGRYCGCCGLLCRNAFQDLFRLLRIHQHCTGSACFGGNKAKLTEPELLWICAIFKKLTNFDAPGSCCDNLHGKYLVGQPEETEGHARVGPHLVVATTGAAFVRAHRCAR